jgi:hypothetical protein
MYVNTIYIVSTISIPGKLLPLKIGRKLYIKETSKLWFTSKEEAGGPIRRWIQVYCQ